MHGVPRLPEQAGPGLQVGPDQVRADLLLSKPAFPHDLKTVSNHPHGWVFLFFLGVNIQSHDLAGVDVGQDMLQAGEESIAGVPVEGALEEGVKEIFRDLVSTKCTEGRRIF